MKLLTEDGYLIWADILCTVPAYRGAVVEIETTSDVALALRTAELAEVEGIENIFN